MIKEKYLVPKLSIAINSYKNPELLRLCLESIEKNVSGIDYEILVADSATEESTRLVMQDFPAVRFFPFEKNVGFVRLVNKTLEEARGEDYFFLINHDIVLTKETIPAFLTYFEKHPDVGIAGGKQINFNGSEQLSAFHFYRLMTILYRRTPFGWLSFGKKHLDWFQMKDYDRKKPCEVDWIMGSAMFVRRKAYEEVGKMDTRFFMYMEDVDWCRRFWEKKWKVMHLPQAVVYHYHGKGSAGGGLLGLFFNRLTWIHIVSAIKYFVKYLGKPLPR